jgi:hypothetical protein
MLAATAFQHQMHQKTMFLGLFLEHVDNIKVFRFREKSQLPAATAFYFR